MAEPQEDRCSGHCCRNFSLPLSPEELMDLYRQWLGSRGTKPDTMPMSGARDRFGLWDPDIHLIAPMAIYLGPEAKDPKYVNRHEKGSDIHRYRCKHWDARTGDCTIYDIRPRMCRIYPGPDGCNYAGCTWSSRKRAKTKKGSGPSLKEPLLTLDQLKGKL